MKTKFTLWLDLSERKTLLICVKTLMFFMLFFGTISCVYAQYVGTRIINGVEFWLYNYDGEDLSAIACASSVVPARVTIPAEIKISENSNIDGTYPVIEVIHPMNYNGAFEGCTSLRTIVIKNSHIHSEAFKNCTNLYSVDWERAPEQTAVESSTFMVCTSLKIVHLPNEVGFIGSQAFQGCSSLENITMPNITYIAEGTFEGCSSLRELVFPSSLNSLWGLAFSGCTGLRVIYCYAEEPPSVNYDSFNGVDVSNVLLVIPDNAVWKYKRHSIWKEFKIETATNICSAKDDAHSAMETYDLSGHQLNSEQKGINILRMSDGTTRKVLVK